jgi:hypothetical protein
MIALAARLRRLSSPERRLLAEATLTLALAALVIAVCPFGRAASLARPPAQARTREDEHRQAINAVRWAILASARRMPWRAKCLERAFAAQWMLRRRSVPAVIHYGIANNNAGLAAHAWVRAGPFDVVGCENAGEFTEIARFPGLASR